MSRYRLKIYYGPAQVKMLAEKLREADCSVVCVGTEHLFVDETGNERFTAYEVLLGKLEAKHKSRFGLTSSDCIGWEPVPAFTVFFKEPDQKDYSINRGFSAGKYEEAHHNALTLSADYPAYHVTLYNKDNQLLRTYQNGEVTFSCDSRDNN